MVLKESKCFDSVDGYLAMFQFSDNLKIIKRSTKTWSKKKCKYSQEKLHILWHNIANIFNSNMKEVFNEEEMQNLKSKEAPRLGGKKWRQKIEATWIDSRDENTWFFHTCAKLRHNIKTIWIIKNESGN